MRWCCSAVLAALVLIASALVSLSTPHPTSAATTTTSTAPAPAAHPPYGVGRETLNLVDHSRGTPANGSAPALPYRNLTTWVLYPAAGAPTAQPQANAPPANDGKPFPVIVFAHGLDSEGFVYDPLLQQWVEKGFVVVAPTFPLSNLTAPGGDTAKDLVNQPGDMSFVLSQVLALSAAKRQPAFRHDRPSPDRGGRTLARRHDGVGLDREHVLPRSSGRCGGDHRRH